MLQKINMFNLFPNYLYLFAYPREIVWELSSPRIFTNILPDLITSPIWWVWNCISLWFLFEFLSLLMNFSIFSNDYGPFIFFFLWHAHSWFVPFFLLASLSFWRLGRFLHVLWTLSHCCFYMLLPVWGLSFQIEVRICWSFMYRLASRISV